MKDLSIFTKDLKDQVNSHRKAIRLIKAHESLGEELTEMVDRLWTTEHKPNSDGAIKQRYWSMYFMNCITQAISLDIYLSEIDTLKKDIAPILEYLMIDMDLRLGDETQGDGYKYWKFYRGIYPDTLSVYVYFWFGNSISCKSVPTGEFEKPKPIMKIVCED